MAGAIRLVALVIFVFFIVPKAAWNPPEGYFSGGYMSFVFTNSGPLNKTFRTARLTVITGWTLRHGPCWKDCNTSDVGRSTQESRKTAYYDAYYDRNVFGNWSQEQGSPNDIPITEYVFENIRGRVSAVSETLDWEQEIAVFDINISTASAYVDITLKGNYWRTFDLNPGSRPRIDYSIQAKMAGLQKRNDTGRPNSSPLVLYKPIYRVELNKVTEIRLTTSDEDGDYVRCYLSDNVEFHRITQISNVTVSEDCVVTVLALPEYGFHDNGIGLIGVSIEDHNREPLDMEGRNRRAFSLEGLSMCTLQFMIWAVENLTVPIILPPTPQSQHVFEVYAGSQLQIPLAAKPSAHSLPTTKVVSFNLLTLPDHALPQLQIKLSDQNCIVQCEVTSLLEWRTSDADTGNFIVQVVAVDSEGFESEDRTYRIHVNNLQQRPGIKTGAGPYFPFFPLRGSLTCRVGSTCSIPIFASPGTVGRTITSIGISSTQLNDAQILQNAVELVQYRGTRVYRADVHFNAQDVGDKSICFVAVDNTGANTKQCTEVNLSPATNPCASMQCHSLATCIPDPDGKSFKCLCSEGKTGTLCKESINPCLSNDTNPCYPGGSCISSFLFYNWNWNCTCDPGYILAHKSGQVSGQSASCKEVNECVPTNPCFNGGTCIDTIHGHNCLCAAGYTGLNCSTPPSSYSPCILKGCAAGSLCVMDDATTARCLCPLGTQNVTCDTPSTDNPVLELPGPNFTHAVEPTLRPGSQITCSIGSTCKIPIFIKVVGGPPLVMRGVATPGLMTSVTDWTPDKLTGFNNTVTSTLTIQPQMPGLQTACVDVLDTSQAVPEQICYTINATTPVTGSVAHLPDEKKFTDETPPYGSVINCVKDLPCHIFPQTGKPQSNATCNDAKVQPASEGVYSLGVRTDAALNVCATDLLLQPKNIPTDTVCIIVGSDGEKRCYTVNTIEEDPCKPNPCNGHGVCMPDTSTSNFTCICDIPWTGPECLEKDSCDSQRCEHQGVCETIMPARDPDGFLCHCQRGYSADNCRKVDDQCSTKQCEGGSVCVIDQPVHQAVCKCPLGKGPFHPTGSTCAGNETVPLVSTDPAKPYAVVPTLSPGTTIHCVFGSTCLLPVFFTGDPENPPVVITGPTSPGVTTVVNPPVESSTPPGTLKSTLMVTPNEEGTQHLCVQILETSDPNSDPAQTICYNIDSSVPVTVHSRPPPEGGRFIGSTPQPESKLQCRTDTPCHILTQTERFANGTCQEVVTGTVGVYTYSMTEKYDKVCTTDVLIDPNVTPACIRVSGSDGEKRCFEVTTSTTDPCSTNPCAHEGLCIINGLGYTCACKIPYGGPACSIVETCASGRCLNQAVCVDASNGQGFTCRCQPGYRGDDCRHIPAVCASISCYQGAVCIEVNGKGVCECPAGFDGDTCHNGNIDIPINTIKDLSKPHLVVPTLSGGMVINCALNEDCEIPITITDIGGPLPTIGIGPTSPGLGTRVTPPSRPGPLHDTLMSKVTVTPTQTGEQHVCIDVKDLSGMVVDTVCYTVNVLTAVASTPPTTVGTFAPGTPPDHSVLTCQHSTPCHVAAYTHKPPSGDCKSAVVTPITLGVFSYQNTLQSADSNICITDILIDPLSQPTNGLDSACIQAGVGGEKRCFTVNAVNSTNDPCEPSPCENGGHCIPGSTATGPVCVCPRPYSGADCSQVDNCQASATCMNQGGCRDGGPVPEGYQCDCQPGFSGVDCRDAPSQCSALSCDHGGFCQVDKQGHPECKCPLGYTGVTCTVVSTDVPVHPVLDLNQPHLVVPTPTNGLQIKCTVGETCDVPLFLHNKGPPPDIGAGQKTPGISGTITVPGPATLFNDTLTSTLSLTPTSPGIHHFCVNVKNGPTETDSICYTINSEVADPTTLATTPPPGGVFTGQTPPDGSRIMCRSDTPCHILAQSVKQPGKKCDDVRTMSPGLTRFPLSEDINTCITDFVVDPNNINNGQACIQTGQHGEERCYTVEEVNSAIDPCVPCRQCQNEAQCVNMPGPLGFHLVCPPFFTGQLCDTEMTDIPINRGADKTKPHAVVPTAVNGMEIHCETGAECQIPIYLTPGSILEPGEHTPDVNSSTTDTPVAVSMPHNTVMAPLRIIPQTDGTHRACVNIKDAASGPNGIVTDSICYTIISNPPSAVVPNPTTVGGGQFKEGTPPNGTDIKCQVGVPCQLIVHTDYQGGQCVPVQTTDLGMTAFNPVRSAVTPADTCDTVVTIDPQQIRPGDTACIAAVLPFSSVGEQRCYTVTAVTNAMDKCHPNNPCENGGQCLLVPSMPDHFDCVCPNGFAGHTCKTAQCEASGQCQALLMAGCSRLNGVDICECMLGSEPPICLPVSTLSPVTPNIDTHKPHFVEPTPFSGFTINCELHGSCFVLLYISGPNSQPVNGPSSPGASAVVQTYVVPAKDLPTGTQQTKLTVQPKQLTDPSAPMQACVDLKDMSTGQITDSVCYKVNVLPPGSVTLPPTVTGFTFSAETPPDGSEFVCHEGEPCHVIVTTNEHRPQQSSCKETVAPDGTAGVFPKPLSSDNCTTDVVLDPRIITNNQACIKIGTTGEHRCFHITVIPSGNNPCAAKPCENGGVCISQPDSFPNYRCVCRQPTDMLPQCKTAPVVNPTCSSQTVCKGNVPCNTVNGEDVCRCPMGTQPPFCDPVTVAQPVNHVDQTKPHLVEPTAQKGVEFQCFVGTPCTFPIYVSGTDPHITLVPEDSTLKVNKTALIPSKTFPPGSLTTDVIVTPQAEGPHSICVNVQEDSSSSTSDSICYTINVVVPTVPPTAATIAVSGGGVGSVGGVVTVGGGGGHGSGLTTDSSISTGTVPQTPAFVSPSLPSGSKITCSGSLPSCHITVAVTPSVLDGNCTENVHATSSSGVYTAVMTPDNCMTDVIIDPRVLKGNQACVKLGTSGEERCYKIEIISSDQVDPCASRPCSAGENCVMATSQSPPFRCVCQDFTLCGGMPPVVSVETPTGFPPLIPTVQAPATTLVTTQAPIPGQCVNKSVCQDSHTAGCAQVQGVDTCQCVVGAHGDRCQTVGGPLKPVNPDIDITMPHIVDPSPANGLEINCRVHEVCKVPIYLTGPSKVELLPPPSGIHGSVSTPSPATEVNVLPTGTLTFILTLVPDVAGRRQACMDIKNTAGQVTDTVCYTINSLPPESGTPTPPPLGPTFGAETLPGGSQIACYEGEPCHLIVTTHKGSPFEPCMDPVEADGTPGVFAKPVSRDQCTTNVVIDPRLIGPDNQACIRIGSNGEIRCYNITTLQGSTEPCRSVHCENHGVCVNQPKRFPNYTCICRDSTNKPPNCESAPVVGSCSRAAQCNGAHCSRVNNVDQCQCPLATKSPHCEPDISDTPKTPTIVSPTVRGVSIQCQMGMLCVIPIYTAGVTPCLEATPSTLDMKVNASTVETPEGFPPDRHLSHLEVTPMSEGEKTVCVDVSTCGPLSTRTDQLCYTIRVEPPIDTSVSTTPLPPGPHFTPDTLPGGTVIPCTQGQMCHISITTTPTNPGGTCEALSAVKDTGAGNPQGVNAYPITPDKCMTDITINPDIIIGNQACVKIVSNGQMLCYEIKILPKGAKDPCESKPCSFPRICMTVVEESPPYKCVCRDPDPAFCPPEGTSLVGQCDARMDQFKEAAMVGKVRCTCRKLGTNQTFTVIKPRVSNERLLHAASIGSGVSIGLIGIVSIIVFLLKKLKCSITKTIRKPVPFRGKFRKWRSVQHAAKLRPAQKPLPSKRRSLEAWSHKPDKVRFRW